MQTFTTIRCRETCIFVHVPIIESDVKKYTYFDGNTYIFTSVN